MSGTPVILNRQQSLIGNKSLEGKTRLVINRIPATIKTTMKRPTTAAMEPVQKSAKYSLQTINSAGTPLTSLQWQTLATSSARLPTTIVATKKPANHLNAVINSLPPNTTIQAKSTGQVLNVPGGSVVPSSELIRGTVTTVTPTAPRAALDIKPLQLSGTLPVRRPTVFIKHDLPKRTPRDITIELVEKNPQLHLGIPVNRLHLLKLVICETANVSHRDCYLALKKIRQNEDFTVLAEYFDTTEAEAQQVFARTITKLARYMRFLLRYPDANKRYERLKNLPFGYRCKMTHVQSIIECVETDLQEPAQMDCLSYKYILGVTPNGIICYVSEAFIGYHDDLVVFNASNFNITKPAYMKLVTDPGKAIRRKRQPKAHGSSTETDSADETLEEDPETQNCRPIGRYGVARIAGEIASYNTLSIVDKQLTSSKVKDFSVPTTRMPGNTMCRNQMHDTIDNLREFKILQHHGIKEPLIYQYINEILICAAALLNLQQ